MIVHGDGEDPLGLWLPDDIVVKHLADFARRRDAILAFDQRGLAFLADDIHAQFDAFVANKDGRTGDKLANFMLALAAERAIERVLCIAFGLSHYRSPFRPIRSPRLGRQFESSA